MHGNNDARRVLTVLDDRLRHVDDCSDVSGGGDALFELGKPTGLLVIVTQPPHLERDLPRLAGAEEPPAVPRSARP